MRTSEGVDVLRWIRTATTGLHCLCENSPAALDGPKAGRAIRELVEAANAVAGAHLTDVDIYEAMPRLRAALSRMGAEP